MRCKNIQADLVYPLRAVVGESCLWDPDNHQLLWVDILDHKIYSFDPERSSNTGFDIGQDVGSVVLTGSGLWAYSDQAGIGFLNPVTGEIIQGQRLDGHHPDIRFNDGKCDPRGTFWAGTMAYDGSEGVGNLYEFDISGKIKIRIKGTTMSNGMAWSKDRSKFYFIDSPAYEIREYNYDRITGNISYHRIAALLDKDKGMPDGMAIDDDDHLWIALFDGGKVIRVDPETGKIVFEVVVPAPKVTSCAFGGTNLDDLYITTASYLMNDDQLGQFPLSGSLFRAKVPFTGMLPHKMKI